MATQLIRTKRGLPNTCSHCAAPIKTKDWSAVNEDAARSGKGLCDVCVKAQAEPPKPPQGNTHPKDE